MAHAFSLYPLSAAGPATFRSDLGGHVGPAPARLMWLPSTGVQTAVGSWPLRCRTGPHRACAQHCCAPPPSRMSSQHTGYVSGPPRSGGSWWGHTQDKGRSSINSPMTALGAREHPCFRGRDREGLWTTTKFSPLRGPTSCHDSGSQGRDSGCHLSGTNSPRA